MRARTAVIPAAGMGTRFLPATKAVPKELLPIIDTPALQLIIDEARDHPGELTLALTAKAQVGWNTYSKAFFNPSGKLSEQWSTGQVSNALGYQWYVDENLPTQTIGALGGRRVIEGANQTGTTINLKGWTPSVTGVLNVGDVISYSGVFNVNPQSRLSTGQPFQQVVQASDGARQGIGVLEQVVLGPYALRASRQ